MAFFLEGKRNTDFPTTNHPSPCTKSLMQSNTRSTHKRKNPIVMHHLIPQQNLIDQSANRLENKRIMIFKRKELMLINRPIIFP